MNIASKLLILVSYMIGHLTLVSAVWKYLQEKGNENSGYNSDDRSDGTDSGPKEAFLIKAILAAGSFGLSWLGLVLCIL